MAKSKDWHVYIIQTESGRFYTGITTDLDRRFNEHTKHKGAKYFRFENPDKIVFTEVHKNRSEATKREIEIKKLSKNEKKQFLSNFGYNISIKSK